MGEIFHELLVRPLINVLVIIYQVLLSFGVPYALGFSIILLTVFLRLVMYPLITSQLKASKKMQAVAPHLSKLKEKHKNDAAKLQQETMLLYKEHGVNPIAGCLPLLIQMPIIFALYSVLQQVVGANTQALLLKVNQDLYSSSFTLTKMWDSSFFGIPLAGHPSELMGAMPFLLLIPVVTALLQFIQSKMMFTKPVEEVVVLTKKQKKNAIAPVKKSTEQDFATAFQTQSMYIFPVMIGLFSYNFPVGLSLYWNTFTLFGILQQYHIQGLGGLEEWIQKIKGKNNEKNR